MARKTLGLADHTPIPKGLRLPISGNAQKARVRLSKLHARIANIRQEGLHKLTSWLRRRFHRVLVKELKVGGMEKNR
ncbi:transposase [Methylacidiphilum sp. Yel]|uniref:transposase n=1 Tax=Methylacidiphilum sp. Yel TaxID=1847730 RepID=UPI003263D072